MWPGASDIERGEGGREEHRGRSLYVWETGWRGERDVGLGKWSIAGKMRRACCSTLSGLEVS